MAYIQKLEEISAIVNFKKNWTHMDRHTNNIGKLSDKKEGSEFYGSVKRTYIRDKTRNKG